MENCKNKGVYLHDHVKIILGNSLDTRFCIDKCMGDTKFKDLFHRLYLLGHDPNATVLRIEAVRRSFYTCLVEIR